MAKAGRTASHRLPAESQQQVSLQLLPQPQLPWPMPPQEEPQQHQSRIRIMMSHRQEQSLFPLLKHMIVTSL